MIIRKKKKKKIKKKKKKGQYNTMTQVITQHEQQSNGSFVSWQRTSREDIRTNRLNVRPLAERNEMLLVGACDYCNTFDNVCYYSNLEYICDRCYNDGGMEDTEVEED